ncbi:MAG: peroxiredoxin [Candidatus Cellulosilyticum pullistercoris]|uniref:Peroxiredoxin n=1 Tax=Candidatus Cellulosilyticum pullistercoris TaxID=2838521 RepID=A0A9E2NKP4_9FIRM|nr:peroxiredoxin [Candidatus Cellulosilyticum pullistercoris]
MLLIGDYLPNMVVQTTQGMKKIPEDYKGSWLILFSHLGDFTPVCTTEFVSFAKNMETFERLNTKLLGLSVDQVQPHIKWIEWIKDSLEQPILFPIIADSLGRVASELGMVRPDKPTSVVRATFIIDPTGKIRMILYYPAEVGRNMEEIIRALVALQVADDNEVAVPANWPYNELIGDQVIIPPPTTVQEAEKVASMYSHYDWWFAYKPLE